MRETERSEILAKRLLYSFFFEEKEKICVILGQANALFLLRRDLYGSFLGLFNGVVEMFKNHILQIGFLFCIRRHFEVIFKGIGSAQMS